MKHLMPLLPYAKDALSPVISAETIDFHYGKHLQTYVENLNKLIQGTLYEEMELEEIVCKAHGSVYNNAAQVWNHEFYFASLTPTPKPMGNLLVSKLTQSFGSIQAFKEQFLASATGLFGAGWTWLSTDSNGNLAITNESNAGNPLTNDMRPLLTIDVWEHAYYVDYRNRRADYLKAIWEFINWEIVEQRMKCDDCNVYI